MWLEPPPGPAPCPTAADIEGLDFPVSFEGYLGGSDLACRKADGSLDLNVVQKNVYSALLFMQRVEFDRPLPWTDKSLWAWFRSAADGVRIRTDIPSHFCCQPSRVLNLKGDIVADSTLPTGYLTMLVHEARHAEGRNHTCKLRPSPLGGSTYILDQSIEEMGAFGVQYYVLQWIGRHWTGGTAAEREYAVNHSEWLKIGAFCDECK